MNSSPLGSILFIAGSLLLPIAVAGPRARDASTTTDALSVDAIRGSRDVFRRALLAPTARASERQASFATDAVWVPARKPTSVGHCDAQSRAAHAAAPAGEETCAASGRLPGVHFALRVVAQQFGAPVTQLLDEYQAYRSSWQGRD
jgi:hypothetical protein